MPKQTTKTTTRRARNTFARNQFGVKTATVFACDCCTRQTRYTGVQSLGSKLCPQCYELAGIENEISDGHAALAERRATIDGLIAEIEAKGGTPREAFAALLVEEKPEPEPLSAGDVESLVARSQQQPELTLGQLEAGYEIRENREPRFAGFEVWQAGIKLAGHFASRELASAWLDAACTRPAEERDRKAYDAAQTEKCDRLRAHLQSIAVFAVQAQDLDPSGDALVNLLGDILDDLNRAMKLSTALNRNDVFAEVR